MPGNAADTYTTVGYSSPSFSAGVRPAVLVVDFQLAFTDPRWPLGGLPLIHAARDRTADLLRADPPDKRSRLEVALERAQTEPLYERLHLPPLKASAALPDAALEHLVGLLGTERDRLLLVGHRWLLRWLGSDEL